MNKDEFQELIWQKGRELYRDMPWRKNTDPYFVLVSELMLQQTQVDRVIPKFTAFIERFPTVRDLVRAPISDVLILWNGLGYNRRAKFLHDASKKIVDEFGGEMPTDTTSLVSLPGIGPNTAGAIMAYSLNQPAVFVETNIRTVLFHHFFDDHDTVTDKELMELLVKLLPVTEKGKEQPDGRIDSGPGAMRKTVGLSQSAHYKKQSALKGSIREVRGQIIKALTAHAHSEAELRKVLDADKRFDQALGGLVKDQLISLSGGKYHLTK